MGIKGFFRNFLEEKKTIEINADYSQEYNAAAVEAFALSTVISFIASLLASCEIKTFEGGKPVKGADWYMLNILPNRNFTKTEFWQEYWQRLLFYGDVLVIPRHDGLIIADNYSPEEYVAYDTIFRNISRDTFSFGDMKMEDVFYLKRRACKDMSFVKSVLSGYAELIGSASSACLEEASHKGTLEVPALAQGQNDFEEKFKDLMENYFKSFFKNRNAVIPLFSGMKYTPVTGRQRTTSSASEYKTLFDDAIKRCAQAYGVSPALVSGDVAGIKDALKFTLTACIDPLAESAGAMWTARNYTEQQILRDGKYIKIDTSGIQHINVFDIAESVDKLIADGMYSIDELREKIGDYKLQTKWSEQHYITKNYQGIETAGGED